MPATARAQDPLLSGYGGPGTGEQVLLGAELLPGRASKSLRAQGRTPITGAAVLTAAPRTGAAPQTPAGAGTTSAGTPGASSGNGSGRTSAQAGEPFTSVGGLPVKRPYPVADGGGLSLGLADLAIAAFALLALAGTAVLTRRMAGHESVG